MSDIPNDMTALYNQDVYYKTNFRQGLWRGEVVSVDDPQQRGRIQVRIIQLHPPTLPTTTGQAESGRSSLPLAGVPDDRCPWAEPAFPFGGSFNNGFVMLPRVGSTVWVAFEHGFTGKPIWLGGWYGRNEIPVEFKSRPSDIRMIRTPIGHDLIFDDNPASRSVKLRSSFGHQVLLDDVARQIEVKTIEGHRVLLDDTADRAVIELNGGSQKVEITTTQVKLFAGALTLILDQTTGKATVNGDLAVTGDLTVAGEATIGSGPGAIAFSTHVHGGVDAGPDTSGPPESP